MKPLLLFIFFILSSSTLAQKESAIGRYAENGNLISLTNLTGLSDCTPANVVGKIDKVKVEESLGHVNVRSEDTESEISVPLDRLKPEDRSAIFKQLLRKKAKVRIAGYRCKTEDPITAFSIDRIY
jgi:hypothetical protein